MTYKKPIIKDWNYQFDDLWEKLGQKKLVEIVIDKDRSPMERFMANEILFYKEKTFEQDPKIIAEIYPKIIAIEQIPPNVWGLPPYLSSTARRLIATGELAVDHLLKLIKNKTTLLYEGSEEATMGDIKNYRVCDLVAFFISKIIDFPIKIDQNLIDLRSSDRKVDENKLKERDSEIEKLVVKLKKIGHL